MLNNAVLSAETLAAVLEQSVDCVKLVGLDGSIRWMNPNGQCAMEIDDFAVVDGRTWAEMWPAESRDTILGSLATAGAGSPSRFDAFCPTAKGTPRWWNVTVSPVSDMTGTMTGFLAISRDITEAETGRQALEIAAAELRHRLKNTYAMIGSLFTGFARGHPDRETFAREMQERLVALSVAQSLFSTHEAPCDIATLIPALVEPFARPACPVTLGMLPATQVSQGQADAIALVLGELAVNSTKHGALAGGGTLAIDADDGADALTLRWTERSLVPVRAHARTGGQGLRLIERIVRARDGSFAIDWHDDGLTVTLGFARP